MCYPRLVTTFLDLSIPQSLTDALGKRAIVRPTPVQAEVIPRLLSGESVLFQSETGTGKTLCYLLPGFVSALDSLGVSKGPPTVLITAPTHELASQIRREAQQLAEDSNLPVKATLLIGSAPLKRQVDSLKEKPSIVIGGPARLIELVRLKKLDLRSVRLLVIDEADRLLSPELRDALAELLSLVPASARTAACSATVTKRHADLLSGMLAKRKDAGDSRLTIVTIPSEDVLARNIAHWAFFSESRDKTENLRKFIAAEKPAKLLAFTAVAGQVDGIAAKLRFKGVQCAALHAKLDKGERKKALDDFRSGRVAVLVTSDLSARGLDIPDVTHVVQLDVSNNEDFFVHRAGRTARAGKSGVNAVFGDETEMLRLSRIEKRLGIKVYPKVLYGGIVRAADDPSFDRDQ